MPIRTRLLLRWSLVAVPLVLGGAYWVAASGGLVPDPVLTVRLTAAAGAWALAAAFVLTGLGAALAAVATRGQVVRRRLLRDQATASTRERRLLLSRLDHELKNPLMAMRAAVANAAIETTPVQRPALASIEEQVLRLSRLTADLRKIADIETGQLDRRPVDLTALLEEAVEIVSEQPAAAGREIKLDLPRAPWPLPAVDGDMDLLSLAVVNLLDNAVKYTPSGGTIEVRAREAADQVLVEVADTGPGIGPADLPHIWDELYRSAQTRGVPGSGLGLPLVRAVVQRHGGTATAESRVGRGTAVRIRLPVSPTADPGAGSNP